MSNQQPYTNSQMNTGAPPEFLFPMNPNRPLNFNLSSYFQGNSMGLQSHSIFAYQEYDQFSSFLENTKHKNQTQQYEHFDHHSTNSSLVNDSVSKHDSSSYKSNDDDIEIKDKKRENITLFCRKTL